MLTQVASNSKQYKGNRLTNQPTIKTESPLCLKLVTTQMSQELLFCSKKNAVPRATANGIMNHDHAFQQHIGLTYVQTVAWDREALVHKHSEFDISWRFCALAHSPQT